MSTKVTVADLNDALQPLIDAVESIQSSSTVSAHHTTQTALAELTTLCFELSSKMDVLLKKSGVTAAETKALPKKRAVAKKPAVRKKALDSSGSEASDDDTVNTAADDNEDSDTEQQQVTQRKPAKTVKKPTKAPAKKATTGKLNVMMAFRKLYAEDSTFCDSYLKPKIKEQIAEDNAEKWSKLPSAKLPDAQRDAYYNYMKTKHGSVLQTMRDMLNNAAEKSNTVIEDHED